MRRTEIITPSQMSEADRRTIEEGLFTGPQLMDAASQGVLALLLERYPAAGGFDILCGPGNNGGDGYTIARLLAARGVPVTVHAEGAPRRGSDAALAARRWAGKPAPLDVFTPARDRVVIDALYGAGLARPLSNAAGAAARKCREAGAVVVAVDLPSGLSGETGRHDGEVFAAQSTVTFARRKPGHLLASGPALCGAVAVVDIGIPDRIIEAVCSDCFENGPSLWREELPRPGRDTHKYSRGHVLAFSGGMSATGAGRLSAMAAARAGAGAVTLASPPDAMAVNAAHLTSIMLVELRDSRAVADFIAARKVRAAVIGPGFGVGERIRDFTLALLSGKETMPGLVLDADVITAWRDNPGTLFKAIGAGGAQVVLTPHEGEFARLFPDIAEQPLSKLEKTRSAARRAGATVIYKGADTVIAAADGCAAINCNGVPWLATAGSGDVLAGIVAGLLAQDMPAWEAACAAVWMHAEAAGRFGPGLIAEDLPACLPAVLAELYGLGPKSI